MDNITEQEIDAFADVVNVKAPGLKPIEELGFDLDFLFATTEESPHFTEPQRGDENIIAVFEDSTFLNLAESRRRGLKRYEDSVVIKWRQTGDNKNFVTERLKFFVKPDGTKSEIDKKGWTLRFPKQWEQYKAKKNGVIIEDGTSINNMSHPLLTKAMILNLQSLGITTIEKLAAVSDGYLGNIGIGARDLRAAAQKVVGELPEKRWQKEKEDLLERIAKLEAKSLSEDNSATSEPTSKKQGRKKKEIELEETENIDI